MHRRFTCLVIFLFLLAGCGENCNPSPAQPSAATHVETNSKAQILNSIVVHEKGGLTITRAFLSDPNGALLNAKNLVKEHDTVLLNLVIKEGWMADHGAVSIGASQQITTATGEPVLSSPDLFAQQPEFPVARAGFLQLKTTIAEARPQTREFIVSYRIWDKNGPGEVSGRYKLSLAAPPAK